MINTTVAAFKKSNKRPQRKNWSSLFRYLIMRVKWKFCTILLPIFDVTTTILSISFILCRKLQRRCPKCFICGHVLCDAAYEECSNKKKEISLTYLNSLWHIIFCNVIYVINVLFHIFADSQNHFFDYLY